jgi:hypothetical protein
LKQRDEVIRDWRELHNEELHSLYSSLNIIRVIKSRRMRWEEYVVCKGEMSMGAEFWLENLKGKEYLKDLSIGERIILKLILKK